MTEPLPPGADAGADTGPASGPPELPAGGPDPEPVDVAAAEPGIAIEPTTPAEPVGQPAAAPPGRRPALVLGYLAAAVAGALLLGGSLVAFGGVGRAAPSPTPAASPSPTPAPNIAAGPSLGSAAAPVTIDIWADYQCPYCRLETMVFGGSLERTYVLPGIARIVYHDFAFLGQESTDAAVAARCAGRQDPGAYWRYHDLLFASQQGENEGTFKRANLVALAGIASLDTTAFSACLDDPAVAGAVAAETAQGRALGITSTPTLRLTGPGGTRTLAGFSANWATIRDAVTAVLAPTPTASPAPGGSGLPASPGASPATP